MKTFWTKKNLAIVLAVLLVVVIVVLCITLRQKSVADTDPTLTLTCQSADADGACTVDVVLSGLPDGAHYEAASLAVTFDPTQITFLGTSDGDIPLVMGAAVIVGRRTLDDFPGGRPLPGRENLVLTRQNITIDGAQVVHSPAEAVAAAARYDRCFVIGGDSVFRQMFPHLTRVYVTKIDSAPHSDVFFPDLDADPAWRCVSSEPRAEHDGVGYQFCVYEKVKE